MKVVVFAQLKKKTPFYIDDLDMDGLQALLKEFSPEVHKREWTAEEIKSHPLLAEYRTLRETIFLHPTFQEKLGTALARIVRDVQNGVAPPEQTLHIALPNRPEAEGDKAPPPAPIPLQ